MERVNGCKDMHFVLMVKINRYQGVVLVGGQSSRMGTDKSQLSFRGQTLLDYAIELLKRTLSLLQKDYSQIFLSGNLYHPQAIPDSHVGLGPLSGVRSVLDYLSQEPSDSTFSQNVIFIPVDMPALNFQILYELVSKQGNSLSSQFEGYELPFVIKNQANVRKTIQQMLIREHRSLHQLHNELGSDKIPISPEKEVHFMNINTPTEWSQFQSIQEVWV